MLPGGERGVLAGVDMGWIAVLYLLRHPAVDRAFSSRCYGQTDVPLDDGFEAVVETWCDVLGALNVGAVWHSGLSRTERPARLLSERWGVGLRSDTRLRERCFGTWEGRTWDEVYADVGDAMNGMLTHPETYAPGGGETTYAMRDRVCAWYREHGPYDAQEVVVAVTHGGPIAALRGTLRARSVEEWLTLIPACGEVVRVGECVGERGGHRAS